MPPARACSSAAALQPARTLDYAALPAVRPALPCLCSARASALRLMLRRRDHELSKLVMRVVSLQVRARRRPARQASRAPLQRGCCSRCGSTLCKRPRPLTCLHCLCAACLCAPPPPGCAVPLHCPPQELINQGHALPVTRYGGPRPYEAASFM